MASIRALTAEAKAELLIGEGHSAEAIRELQIACALWNEIGSAINAADARLSLAALLIQLEDRTGAELELGTALSIARKVESPRLMRRCEELEALGAARCKGGRPDSRTAIVHRALDVPGRKMRLDVVRVELRSGKCADAVGRLARAKGRGRASAAS